MTREGREEKGRSNLLSDATLAKLCVYSHLRLLFEMGRFRISFFEVCAQGLPRRLQAAVICIHAQNTHSWTELKHTFPPVLIRHNNHVCECVIALDSQWKIPLFLHPWYPTGKAGHSNYVPGYLCHAQEGPGSLLLKVLKMTNR